MSKYYPPRFKAEQFHCIHCGVYAAQSWNALSDYYSGYTHESPIWRCYCTHCQKFTYWHENHMVVPAESPIEPHHTDMPTEIVTEYDEARAIFARSPRAAAALLRLAVQKLMPVLGQPGKNINDDIGALWKTGVPIEVQQTLDYCRVVGNNAVHPGEIDLNDTPEMAQELFQMLNFIVEDLITRPKTIKARFGRLPATARQAIEKRDEPRINNKK